MKYKPLELSTDEYLEQFREYGSKAVPCYLLPLHELVPDKSYDLYLEFWKGPSKFRQLAIWWFEPGKDTMSEIVLPCHTEQVSTCGHVTSDSQMVRPLTMEPYAASGTIPARPAYNLWPIWPYVRSLSVCRDHGGVAINLYRPHMATHFSVSASLSTTMSLSFTDKKK